MKVLKLVKLAAVMLASLAMIVALSACGEQVAATINGVKVTEASITARIMNIREQNESYKDDKTWASVLKSAGLTPETLREQFIDSVKEDVIIRQAAEEKGLSADKETVEQQIQQAKTTIGGDDSTWLEALKKYGYQDEADLRSRLEISDLQSKLADSITAEPDAQALEEYLQSNAIATAGRRSSTIVLPITEDTTAEAQTAKAEEILAKLADNGDFAALAKEYSADATSAENGGDIGWSAMVQPSQVYLEALNTLQLDQVSPVINDGNAIYLIKCTGIFEPVASEEKPLDVSTIPAEIKSYLEEQYASNTKSEAYTNFIMQRTEAAEVTINPMPADVPYNVDMTLADTSDDSSTSSAADDTMPAIDPSELTGALVIVDKVEGTGDGVKEGDAVTVRYTGYFTDGKVFDSTARNGNTPFSFTVGAGGVIKGWDTGLIGMRVGGSRHLVIPSDLAYGANGSGSTIPPNTDLAFEIELVSIDNASGADASASSASSASNQ